MPIGRSRSVRGSSCADARRLRCAAIADATPSATGRASRPSDQSAATPIAPAPMKRTLWDHTAVATPAAAPAAGCIAVSTGVATPHAMTSPAKIAAPTVMPISCPAPTRASDNPKPMPVAALPARK